MADLVYNFFIFILAVFILALTIGFILFLFDPDGVNDFFDGLFGNKKQKKNKKKIKKKNKKKLEKKNKEKIEKKNKEKLENKKKLRKINNLKKRNIRLNRPQVPSPYGEDKYKTVDYKCQNNQHSMKVKNPENFEMFVNGISQELTDRAGVIN